MVFGLVTMVNRLMPVLIPATAIAAIVSAFQAGRLHIITRDAFARRHNNNKQNSYNEGHKPDIQCPGYLMSNKLLVAGAGFEPPTFRL